MNIHEFNREKVLAIFDEKIEIGERCKGVHCVDLGGSFPTRIYLQKSASIQPRTSPSKFGEKFNSLFTSLLNYHFISHRLRALTVYQSSIEGVTTLSVIN